MYIAYHHTNTVNKGYDYHNSTQTPFINDVKSTLHVNTSIYDVVNLLSYT